MFNTYNALLGEVTTFDDMVGRIVTKFKVAKTMAEEDELILYFTDTNYARFYHSQDCCESVTIDDICGDLNDLVGSPLLVAEEVSVDAEDNKGKADYADSYTWTFYRFATRKGDVTVKWYGTSNGYYSESVNVEFVTGEDHDN
jgi:hypothetical protein